MRVEQMILETHSNREHPAKVVNEPAIVMDDVVPRHNVAKEELTQITEGCVWILPVGGYTLGCVRCEMHSAIRPSEPETESSSQQTFL